MRTDRLIRVLYGAEATAMVQPELRELYESYVSSLWPHVHKALRLSVAGAPPAIEVVHSLAARSQVITGAGGTCLVYDQNFGRICNQLTRLTVALAPSVTIDAYVARLCASKAVVANRLVTAGKLVVYSEMAAGVALAQNAIVVEPERQRNYRSFMVTLQEVFLMAHELCHLLLADRSDGANLQAMAGEAIRRCRDTLDDGPDARVADSGNQRLVEEVICDFAGTLATMLLFAGRTANADCVAGASLGIYHLMFVQHLDSLVARFDAGHREPSTGTPAEVRLRVACLRDMVREFFQWLGPSVADRGATADENFTVLWDAHVRFAEVAHRRVIPHLAEMCGDAELTGLVEANGALTDRRQLVARLSAPLSARPGGTSVLYSDQQRAGLDLPPDVS